MAPAVGAKYLCVIVIGLYGLNTPRGVRYIDVGVESSGHVESAWQTVANTTAYCISEHLLASKQSLTSGCWGTKHNDIRRGLSCTRTWIFDANEANTLIARFSGYETSS